ncbi:helix-turn-helix domain-containing protein [Rodentibacter pneumotropicus]|nr:helix-turn-helix transcriptional regulator [Rodentibacter pneumotropicus]
MVRQLKADRIAKKLSQQDIAQRTGIKTQNISRIERGLSLKPILSFATPKP